MKLILDETDLGSLPQSRQLQPKHFLPHVQVVINVVPEVWFDMGVPGHMMQVKPVELKKVKWRKGGKR